MQWRWVAALGMAMAVSLPTAAPAQEEIVEEVGGSALSAALGAGAGLVGGAYANVAVVVLKARTGHYQHSFVEAFGWESIPIAAGAGTGFAIGFWDEEHLWPGIGGGALGFGAGLGAGDLWGRLRWDDSESRWAHAAIGAAVGMAVGSTAALIASASDSGDGHGGSEPTALRATLLRFTF